VNLLDIFTVDRLKTNRICLIGDAYQGKSYYLKQTAYELKEAGLRFHPLLIEVKQHNVQPLDSLLTAVYGSWRNIPFKDLVLIIDGLDEVPTDKFVEMIKYINVFSKAYQPVSIVLSCRKLFFNHYNIGSKLTEFEIFELYSLQHEDVEHYLKTILRSHFADFNKAVNRSEIAGMLYHPFYLVNLAEEFLKPPHKLPGNKLKVIEGFIERAYHNSLPRQIKGSDSIKQNSYRFKQTIEKLAFALQLAGVNSFNDEEIQQLFNGDEILLLQHNSLVLHSGNNWSFANALFQEHLAASLLSRMKFEEIISNCAVGSRIKKIKTKWIQTIASLLSFLEPSDELFNKILQFLEDDNIELIFQSESSKYTNNFKLIVLKKFIAKCIKLNIRTLLVYEETIGVFIESSALCVDYILECINDSKITERVKVVCCRILRSSPMNESQKSIFHSIVENEITETKDSYYAGKLIEVLSSHKIGNTKLLDFLTSLQLLNNDHEFRDQLYELLLSLGMVDAYYNYGLGGLPYLIKHNKEIHHGGSERNLEEFLLATENSYNLSGLLHRFEQENWGAYFERRSTYKKDFLQCLFEKLEGVFSKNPLIIFPVTVFIRGLGKKYLREEFKEVDTFLEKTASHWLAVRILITDIFTYNNWELGSLITYDSYDYILFEFEEGNFEMQKLRSCFSGLRYKHKNEISNNFYKLCMDLTEGQLEKQIERSKYMDYEEAEQKKRENDLIYIQSLEAFKEGIRKYFDAYGKRSIPEEDIYVDIESGTIRQMADSYFVFEYLVRWNRSVKTIRLNECLKTLEKDENFITFRAEEILDYPYKTEEIESVLVPIQEQYYLSTLPSANFKNCMSMKDGNLTWLRKEFRLGQIFKKYQFQTPEEYLFEFIWLDTGGTRNFKMASLNNSISISQLIIDRLTPVGLLEFRKRIVANIKEGIKLDSVLGSHIALCRYLKIQESRDIILKLIQESANDHLDRTDSVDIYLELGGDLNEIRLLYERITDYNSYFFFHLTVKLYKDFPNEVGIVCLNALNSDLTELQRKVQIAQILAEIGVFEGFAFLVSQVRSSKKSPHHIQNGHPVSKIDTVSALKELADIMYLVIDEKYKNERSFHDSAKSILLEWIFAFGSKSENDMIIVINFLQEMRDNLKGKFNENLDFNWYVNRILEDFRSTDKATKSLAEIKQIFSAISV